MRNASTALRAALSLAQHIVSLADLDAARRLSPSNAAITADQMAGELATVQAFIDGIKELSG